MQHKLSKSTPAFANELLAEGRVFAYLRVSTDRQDSDSQRIGIISKAAQLNITIDRWIVDDGVSGMKEPKERKLGKLLKLIKKGDVIIASELSRLGRNLYMVMRILEHCMKNDCKVYTVKDGYELGDNITSKVLAFAFALAAEIERDMISKRTKEALARKKAEGILLGRPKGSKKKNPLLSYHHEKIIKMLNDGETQIGIARKLKCHRHTVKRYVEQL